MVMSWIWAGLLAISVAASFFSGCGSALSAAIPQGAQAGISLVISMAGSICLWSGVGKLMEQSGLTGALAKLLRPFLGKIFPSSRKDPRLANQCVCQPFGPWQRRNAYGHSSRQAPCILPKRRHRKQRALPFDRTEHRLHPIDPCKCCCRAC